MLIKIISLVFNNNNNNNNNNKASTILYIPVWVGVHVFAFVGV